MIGVRPDVAEPRSDRKSEYDFLAVFGLIALGVGGVSVFLHRTQHDWEPHEASTRQWFVAGALALTFAFVRSLESHWVRARLTGLIDRMRLRGLVTWIAGTGGPVVAFSKNVIGSRIAPVWPWSFGVIAIVLMQAPWTSAQAALQTVAFLFVVAFVVVQRDIISRAASSQGLAISADEHWLRSASRALVRSLFRWRRVGDALRILLSIAAISAAMVIAFGTDRRFAILLGVVSAFIALGRTPEPSRPFLSKAAVALTLAVAWTVSLGISFTPFDDWLLGATRDSVLAPIALVGALLITTLELGQRRFRRLAADDRSYARPIFVGAVVFFLLLSLDTRSLNLDWIPYHRSFWVDPAGFVRNGAWLLWSVPSQYGFFSVLSLALWPAADPWQALYEQTALLITINATITFSLFRFRRRGTLNVAFALLTVAAVYFGDQGARAPFGWRLYPQAGLRFTWMILILGIVFAIYHSAERPQLRRSWFAAGYLVWAWSILWSFETAFFTSSTWLPFLLAWQARKAFIERHLGAWHVLTQVLTPVLVAMPLLGGLYAAIEVFYRTRLHHAPDYRGYFEFSAAYAHDTSLFQPIHVLGPAMTVLLVLAVMGSAGAAAAMQRSRLVPGAVAAFFATWGASTYYAGETFDVHVNAIAPVFITAFALVLALERLERTTILTVSARIAFVPICTILLTQWVSDPTAISGAVLSEVHDRWSAVRASPAMPKQLSALLVRAGVHPSDLVVLPSAVASSKIDTGLIMPFEPTGGGGKSYVSAWVPVSPEGPLNVFYTLPWARRSEYLHRFRQQVPEGGWLVTYHERANCARFDAKVVTNTHVTSPIFDAVKCR